MFEIRRYTDKEKAEWNQFVAQSRQGTFLFNRDYMDYHRNRFCDHSLMFYQNNQLYALLPANIDGDTLMSHKGLTYGGLLTSVNATAEYIAELFKEMNVWLRENGVRHVIYKPVPWIYCTYPSEEALYALTNVCHAALCVRNISTVVNMRIPLKWRHDRHYNANKAIHNGIKVFQDNTLLSDFWRVLNDNLMETYSAKPVHSIAEISYLASTFTQNIKLYVAKLQDNVIGGVVIYIMRGVVHTQYISATKEGKRLHAVDALIRVIMNEWKDKCEYFDFGTSNEDNGRILNSSLISQKEGFGGRGVCYDWYEYNV